MILHWQRIHSKEDAIIVVGLDTKQFNAERIQEIVEAEVEEQIPDNGVFEELLEEEEMDQQT